MKAGYIKSNEEVVYLAVLDGLLEIDSDGRVWRIARRQRNKKGEPVRRVIAVLRHRGEALVAGYLQITDTYNGIVTQCKAHRLVWRAFNGRPIGVDLTINHKNGVKTDNRPENLEEATMSEQQLHAVRVLQRGPATHQYGIDNHRAKITDAQVIEIIERVGRGEIQRIVALDYGLSQGHVSEIYNGKMRTVRAMA